jgi:hypothetical protein
MSSGVRDQIIVVIAQQGIFIFLIATHGEPIEALGYL